MKVRVETDRRSKWQATAANGRFGAMAALAPQQRQYEFGSYYPAGTLVKPPLRQAAGTLPAMRGRQCGGQLLVNNTNNKR